MIIKENGYYEFYAKIDEINSSLSDTYSVKALTKNRQTLIVRFKNDEKVELNSILFIKGTALPYKDRIHIYVDEYKRIEEMNLSIDEIKKIKKELIGSYMVDVNEHNEYIKTQIENINNKIIKDIVKDIYSRYETEFLVHHAATKFHHEYKSGLLEHTYTTLKLGKAFQAIYSSLNSDLIDGGIILHDIMKIEEIDDNSNEYSIKGKLIGHVSLSALEIERTAERMGYADTEEVTLLIHTVISHHDEPEYGSPKRPQIIEALVVHLCDSADAKMDPTIKALEKVKNGELTDQIQVNNKAKFYKHKLSK